MENLMKPAEYAKELGISRQAVYAKIKRGILAAKNVDGKLYIVVDNKTTDKKVPSNKSGKSLLHKTTVSSQDGSLQEYQALLEAKDETIAVLKETVKDLKESNKQISTTLRGEIDLLKEAFHEMRTLYVHQLGHKVSGDAIDIEEHQITHDTTQDTAIEESLVSEQWVGVKKCFKQHRISREKAQKKIIKRLKKAYRKGDDRLSKERGKLKINMAASLKDLLK